MASRASPETLPEIFREGFFFPRPPNGAPLLAVEIGLHCLKAVPTEKGGRGKPGGLREYARRVGRTEQYVSQLRQAAEVLLSVDKLTSQLVSFLDKAQHLAAVHRLPRKLWPEFVQWIGEKQPTVAEFRATVVEPIKRQAKQRKAQARGKPRGQKASVTQQIGEENGRHRREKRQCAG